MSVMTSPDAAAIAAAQTRCATNVGNDVVSCYPTTSTVAVQDEFTSFVWNSNRPDLTQAERVDVHLFQEASREQVLQFLNITNPTNQAGILSTQVNDTWWGDEGSQWNGANISYPFYWIISRGDESLDAGTQEPQATFTAVQTRAVTSTSSTVSTSSSSDSSGTPSSSSTSGDRLHGLSAGGIAGVIVAALCIMLAALAVLFGLRRRKRKRRLARETEYSIAINPLPYSSKSQLNAEMRAVQTRLRSLRVSHSNSLRTAREEGSASDSELHRQIATLTAEVERLRALGAEEPPPYSSESTGTNSQGLTRVSSLVSQGKS